jgi:hypothetical protein
VLILLLIANTAFAVEIAISINIMPYPKDTILIVKVEQNVHIQKMFLHAVDEGNNGRLMLRAHNLSNSFSINLNELDSYLFPSINKPIRGLRICYLKDCKSQNLDVLNYFNRKNKKYICKDLDNIILKYASSVYKYSDTKSGSIKVLGPQRDFNNNYYCAKLD